jgi:hypothetical protein
MDAFLSTIFPPQQQGQQAQAGQPQNDIGINEFLTGLLGGLPNFLSGHKDIGQNGGMRFATLSVLVFFLEPY